MQETVSKAIWYSPDSSMKSSQFHVLIVSIRQDLKLNIGLCVESIMKNPTENITKKLCYIYCLINRETEKNCLLLFCIAKYICNEIYICISWHLSRLWKYKNPWNSTKLIILPWIVVIQFVLFRFISFVVVAILELTQ